MLASMCGACSAASGDFLPYVSGDIVRCVEGAGHAKEQCVEGVCGPRCSPRIGRVQEQCVSWGLAVVWEDGSRQWFSYDKWIEDWDKTGFSVKPVRDASLFQPSADFALAPEEPGRGWLNKPPRRRRAAPRGCGQAAALSQAAASIDASMMAEECE